MAPPHPGVPEAQTGCSVSGHVRVWAEDMHVHKQACLGVCSCVHARVRGRVGAPGTAALSESPVGVSQKGGKC